MRGLIVAAFLSASLFAQTPKPAEPGKPTTEQPGKSFFHWQGMRSLNQAGKPAAGQAVKPEDLKKWEQFFKAAPAAGVAAKDRTVLAPGQPCAIPLTNVLPSAPPPVPEPSVVVPHGQFHIRQVVPPAPSCDDVKK